MFAELYFVVVLFMDGLKWINKLELELENLLYLIYMYHAIIIVNDYVNEPL